MWHVIYFSLYVLLGTKRIRCVSPDTIKTGPKTLWIGLRFGWSMWFGTGCRRSEERCSWQAVLSDVSRRCLAFCRGCRYHPLCHCSLRFAETKNTRNATHILSTRKRNSRICNWWIACEFIKHKTIHFLLILRLVGKMKFGIQLTVNSRLIFCFHLISICIIWLIPF